MIRVGPEMMLVTRNGITSRTVPLDDADGPASVRAKAAALMAEIMPLVAFGAWLRHRLRMARQRRLAALLSAIWPGPYYPCPRPDLIAQRPWRAARQGEWKSLPHGVVHRLLREGAKP